MKYIVFSVYDRAAQCFGRPLFAAAVGAAIRSFQDECNRASDDNPMYKHAKDFDLYQLGTFHDENGMFELLSVPENVAHGGQMQLKLDC